MIDDRCPVSLVQKLTVQLRPGHSGAETDIQQHAIYSGGSCAQELLRGSKCTRTHSCGKKQSRNRATDTLIIIDNGYLHLNIQGIVDWSRRLSLFATRHQAVKWHGQAIRYLSRAASIFAASRRRSRCKSARR